MAVSKLKTEFQCIGRSGKTVDGRTIDPDMLLQVAKNYDKAKYTALIWPEHNHDNYNYGMVDTLKAQKNEEGGIDLFAILAPNDFYLSDNRYGQKLFTSMELRPKFRGTDEWYLTGLGATDNPASAATSEIRFSTSAKDALVSEYFAVIDQQPSEEQPPSWFMRFTEKFTKTEQPDEDTMKKEDQDALIAKFSAMEGDIAALKRTIAASTEKPTDDYSSALVKIEALNAQIETFKSEKSEDAAKLLQFTEAFTALQTEFNKAVGEQNGTDAEEFTGDETNHSDCI